MAEHFIVIKDLTGPIIGLHFIRYNSVVIDTTHGLIQFPHLTIHVKNSASEAGVKTQPLFFHESSTVPPMTTKTITAFVHQRSDWRTTDTTTPVRKITEAASLLISQSISTIIDKGQQSEPLT